MLKRFIFAFVIFSLLIFNFTYAATKEDLINAINKTYVVGEERYRLPQKIITKAENYLDKNPLTEEQYDKILKCIDKAVSLAKEKGTTDISKFSKEEVIEMLNILVEASNTANIDFEKELSEIGMVAPTTSNNAEKKEEVKNENKTDINANGDLGKEKVENTSNNLENQELIKQENSSQIINKVDKEITTNEFESGEVEFINSGEIIPNINVSEIVSKNENVDAFFEKDIKIFTAILVVFLIVIILLFCLILKAKWNKIAKWILIIIFVVLIITTLGILVLIANYTEEIKLIYKLYYIFK